MKSSEIISKIKEVLLSSNSGDVTETPETIEEKEVELAVAEVEVKEEEVSLAEAQEETQEEVKEEVKAEQPMYATLSDLTSLKNEILDMLAQFAEVSKEYKKEVPSELSKEELKEVEVKLSEEVQEVKHSPEVKLEQKSNFKYSQNRSETTMDRVFKQLFK